MGVAIAVSVIAVLVAGLGIVADRVVLRRRLLTYRVQLDSDLAETVLKQPLRRGGEEVRDASVVLIRIGNYGMVDLEGGDVEQLIVEFPGRSIVDVEVSDASPGMRAALSTWLDGVDHVGEGELRLPGLDVRRKERFKLLMLLSGDGTGVSVSGRIRGGRVVSDRPSPVRRAALVMAAVVVLLGTAVTATLVISQNPSCEGQVTILTTSLAEPLLANVAQKCGDAQVAASAVPAETLLKLAKGGPSGANSLVAVSPDGVRNDALVQSPLFTVLYGSVVNPATRITGLTLDQIRLVYSGTVTNWNQVGGADLAVTLVSRGAESQVRMDFTTKVLHGGEPPLTSADCVTRTVQGGPLRCEVSSTAELLARVEAIPGAIGYADVGAVRVAGLRSITLGGNAPDIVNVRGGSYPFWDNYYTYTYGVPGDAVSAFLGLLRGSASEMAAYGFVGCSGVPC